MVSAGRNDRLRGWKEIGRWFGVDERTVKRWEVSRGLPVHRVPGEPRAPVFAYVNELRIWSDGNPATEDAATVPPSPRPAAKPDRRRTVLAGLGLLLVSGAGVWQWQRAAAEHQNAEARIADVRRLADAQVAALHDQLDSQPGTVALRAGLAGEAVQILGKVATLPDASGALRRDAAEAYRRLAVLQNAVDRPSLRDRAAARASLEKGLRLLDGVDVPGTDLTRARVRIESARQAAGGGDQAAAERDLEAARVAVMKSRDARLIDDWWLARSVVLGWKGEYADSIAAARKVSRKEFMDVQQALVQARAIDHEAEGLYYQGMLQSAAAAYRQAIDLIERALVRWPEDSRLRWGLLRQQWNLGSTLITLGMPEKAVPMLAQTLSGWERLARVDPGDESLRTWIWSTRLSYGEALAASGRRQAAIPVLSHSVAERRAGLAERPRDADRRRILLTALASLADVLAPSGRLAEACALYGEATELGAAMHQAGQLTGHDQREMLRLLGLSRQRYCPAARAQS